MLLHYLPLAGGLLPRLPPDGLPVLLGKFGTLPPLLPLFPPLPPLLLPLPPLLLPMILLLRFALGKVLFPLPEYIVP